ncbi:ankyrin repeat [Paramuricea clavata]|uniref:Ankyrin repeat n=1 Tax=Paramuricea clavata TaxID=317549 RepID=A0A6S7FZF1_PARCT|nr:ankyrin repeat [Paramuricea clavata]
MQILRSTPMTYSRASELFKKELVKEDLDAKDYGLHSLRSDGATTAAALGIPDRLQQRQGGAVRRGESFKSTFFQETKLDDLGMKESDSLQRNVFHYAVSKPDTLKTLLEMVGTKTSIRDALHQADKDGEMPIHRAASIANIESLRILLEYDNSLIKLKTTMGKRSVLHSAVKSRSVVAVKFVLSKGPDLVNTVDSIMQSPLHYAASLKQSNVLEFLISKESDLTLTDANDQLALHIAASKGLKSNVVLLLRESPDFIDIIDNSYRSPLLLAAQNNFPTVVSYLLSKNADYEIQDKLGLAAFDWAVSSKFSRVVEVFLDTNDWKKGIEAVIAKLGDRPRSEAVKELASYGNVDSLTQFKMKLVNDGRQRAKGRILYKKKAEGRHAVYADVTLEERLASDICEISDFLDSGTVTNEL